MNVDKIREDFPVLSKKVIYFDSACMSLKPVQVIEKMNEYYNEYPACAGRSVHRLGIKLEGEIADARELVKKFINARNSKEIIFTKNTTESINLLANSLNFKKVLLTDKEHNSNSLPWRKFKYGVIKSNQDFTFNLEKFNKGIKDYDLISFVLTSNVDGYNLPAKEIIKIAHENNVKVHFDAAQTVPHQEIDVKKLDVDFISFSGHKMLGPTGTGVFYGKEELLDEMKQFLVGGETVIDSTYTNFVPEPLPAKFEAGLQNYSGIIGLGAAVKYLQKVGLNNIHEHEVKLVKSVNADGLELIGYSGERGIFNFNIPKVTHHEVAHILNYGKNIMVRSGRHCVHPWYNSNNIDGSVRASFYLYNTLDEVKIFNEEIEKLKKLS
ncbi:cysteine desulfurase [Candidatus Woesearchaeota archaeon]|nr:cysteine desulfurase [Candidatus Woesearchaeota archaeon]